MQVAFFNIRQGIAKKQMKHCIFFVILFLFTLSGLDSFAYAGKNRLQAPLFNNIGTLNHPVSTSVPLAQRFFNQGLTLFYGFEWGESIRSFREATRLDPHCGMCFWGLALALGAKANAPMNGHEYIDAQAAIKKAMSLSQYTTSSEQAYIQALQLRFRHAPKKNKSSGTFTCHATAAESESSSTQELRDYANAMANVIIQDKKDNDAKALYAYALFDVISWKFWDSNGKINPETNVILKTLDSILANNKLHIGGNHYYVHVIEQSPHPADALASAERLQYLVPVSEHLVHMPTHIYFLTGRYHAATRANQQAIAAYNHYSDICRRQGFEPEITYLYHHNFDFLRTTAAMEGRRQLAMSAARELLENLPASWIARNPDLQWFVPIPFYVEARFGMWNDILREAKPNANYLYANGMWHYARGLAYVYTGDLKAAEAEAASLNRIIKNKPGPGESNLGGNGKKLLQIARAVLAAVRADAHDDEKATILRLKVAAKLQHDMGYHEPPDWYFPVQQALGDAYLKYGHIPEALVSYQQDLQQYPENGWSLYGLVKTYRKAGEKQKAQQAELSFKHAWRYADSPIPMAWFQ